MKRSILFFFGLILLVVPGSAQDTTDQEITVIYNEDFGNGLADWEVGEGNPVGAVWQYRPDAAPDSAMIDGMTVPGFRTEGIGPIASLTPENGAAVYNSDVYETGGTGFGEGPFPGGQSATLTSPSIDCSGFANVTLRFNQFAWVWALEVSTFVEVSNDGGNTWVDLPINQDLVLVANTFIDDVVVLDISEVAGNQSDVKVRFTWSGDLSFWVIDDVQLIETPDYNLSIESIFYTPFSFAQPASQIATDTFLLQGEVSNNGKVDRTNVVFKASIINDTRGFIIHEDSIMIDVLPAFYQDSTMSIENTFAPGDLLTPDEYVILYEVYAMDTTADYNVLDDFNVAEFQVTENLYANDDGDRGRFGRALLQPAGGGDYEIGNIFFTSPNSGENFKATKAFFSSYRDDGQGNIDLAGEDVSVLLYKVTDDVEDSFANFDFEPESSTLELVGFADYEYPADYDVFDISEVELFDTRDFTAGVNLESGARYFLTVEYEGSANTVFHVFDRDIPFTGRGIQFVNKSDRWYFGFQNDDRSMPVMRMEIALRDDIVSAKDQILPENSMVILPNPVNDFFNAEVVLEEVSNGMLILADVQGRVLQSKEFNNLQEGNFSFDVSEYPAGSYLLRLSTEKGIRTEKVTVVR